MTPRARRYWFVTAVLAAAPSGALAGGVGCGPFNTDLATAYLDAGDPSIRASQDTDSGWTYHRATPSGPLLIGIPAGSLNVTAGFWGSASLAFNIPTGGPIYSDNPSLNQINFSYRAPSFTGLFLHPGEGDGFESCASLNIQAPIIVTALSGQFEKLGGWDGALCRVVKRIGGVDTDIVPPTFVAPHPSAPATLTPSPGALPLVLMPGDKLWVQTQRFGNANEDWCNANVSLTFDGGPLVPAPATVSSACYGRSIQLRVSALGTGLTYQWRRNGLIITNLPGRYAGVNAPQLTISAVLKSDTSDRYDCVVTSACSGASVVSGEGRIAAVLPDLNSDGIINTADLAAFLGKFGQSVPFTEPADINSDGIVNTADLAAFLGAFGVTCP